MALKVTRARDPITVSNIVMEYHAAPGAGKTSLGFTAEAPLLLAFDSGVYRAAMRKDCVIINDWQEIASLSADDMKPYKTVVVDTVGRAVEALIVDLIKRDPKNGKNGTPSIQGWGVVKSAFTNWLNYLRSLGLDVVLISHLDEKVKGDDIIERIDVAGGSKNEIYKSADVMGRIYLQNRKRFITFSPSDTAFGKNPAQLPPIEIVDGDEQALAKIIAEIKGKLNALTGEQAEYLKALDPWTAKLATVNDAASLNAFVAEAKEAPELVKDGLRRMVRAKAKELSLTADKESGLFK